jgi:hypothetical protein
MSREFAAPAVVMAEIQERKNANLSIYYTSVISKLMKYQRNKCMAVICHQS